MEETQNLSLYLQDLEEESQLRLDEFPSREMAFTATIIEKIGDLINCGEPIIQHCILQDKLGRTNGELHAYAFSSNGEVLSLFYTLYNSRSNEVQTLNSTDCQPAINRLQGIYNFAIRGKHYDLDDNSPEYELCKSIYDRNKEICSINLYILSNYAISNCDIRKTRVATKSVYMNVWDIKKIHGNLHSLSDHFSIDIDFQDDEYKNYKIPFIQMESNTFGYKCILAMFPAKLLYKLYERYNTNLLLNNIRYFLGFKGSKKNNANIEMLKTLKTKNQMFLAYNNGITALATKIEASSLGSKTDVSDNEDGRGIGGDFISMGILEKIVDFRIVNGGQTTASIFFAKNNKENGVSLYGVYVQVKLIICEEMDAISGDITKYSNSQSKIKYSDFSVSNEFNTKMEKLSRSVLAPNDKNDLIYWYFERLRGQYDVERGKNRTKQDVQYFDSRFPKSNKFKKEEIAKVWRSWEQFPFDAVKGESTNYDIFISDIVNRGFIPDENYYKKTIALIIIYKYLLSRPENKNYKNTKATVIAYTIAYLNYITSNRLDLMKIWNNQELSEDLKKYLNSSSDCIFDRLTYLSEKKDKQLLSYGKTPEAFKNLCDGGISSNRKLLEGDCI